MSFELVFLSIFVFAGLSVLLLFLRARRRRRRRLEYRLLVGRQKLAEDELESRFEELKGLDPEKSSALRKEAEAALDQLHVAFIERQAHLLDYEDLVHLQQCKIDLLSAAREAFGAEPPSPRPAPSSPPRERDRTAIENQFLDRISQFHRDGPGRKKGGRT